MWYEVGGYDLGSTAWPSGWQTFRGIKLGGAAMRQSRLTLFRHVAPFVAAAAVTFALSGDANAARSLAEYRYFRTLSIDLQGRMPTRAEIAEFEKPTFSADKWIDDRLKEPAYAERVRRIYMDLMRMEIGGS